MEVLKKATTVKGKAVYDIETLMSRLVVVGQQRNIDIVDILQCPSSFDRWVWLFVIMKESPMPDIIVIDGGQLLYHINWKCKGPHSQCMQQTSQTHCLKKTGNFWQIWWNTLCKGSREGEKR